MMAILQQRRISGISLWRSIIKLLRLRLVIFIGGFRRSKLSRKLGWIILGIIILGVLALVFIGSWFLLRFISSPELAQYVGKPSAFLATVPVIVFTATFIGILLTSFGLLLQALYLAGDMDFLLSAPVPIRAVFISKMLQAILPNFGLILLFGLPLLYGLGASEGYNILYFPLVILLLSAMALAAAGLSSLLVMLIVRVFPARRVAEVLGLFVGLVSILCSQSGQIANWTDVSQQQASQAFQLVSQVNSSWSPFAWGGRGLVGIGQGHWLIGSGLIIATLVLAIGIFFFSLQTAERWYFTGWAGLQTDTVKKKKRHHVPETSKGGLRYLSSYRFIPASTVAIIQKDFIMMRRDLRNMSQLITPLIFGVIYAVLFIRGGGQAPEGRGQAPAWMLEAFNNLMVYGNVGISLFVSWTFLSRVALTVFSQEGRNYWMIKSAPMSSGRILTAKFIVSYLPALSLGWGFILVISFLQHAPLSIFVYSLLVVTFCIAGLTGLNLFFGVNGANFEWQDPRRMAQGGIGCLSSLLSIIFLVFSLGLFFIPPFLFSFFLLPGFIGDIIGLIIGGSLCLAVAIIPLRQVRDKIPRLDEN